MIFTQNSFPILQKQNYAAYDRGDMFIPAKRVVSPLHAAALATAYVGHSPVHSVPVLYTSVIAKTIGSKGMPTPVQAVSTNGS